MTVPADSAAAAKPVRFSYVHHDSPGADTGSNRSLNAEWIRVKNDGNRAEEMKGWTIRHPEGRVYRFRRLRLGPGKSATLYTGSAESEQRGPRSTLSHVHAELAAAAR